VVGTIVQFAHYARSRGLECNLESKSAVTALIPRRPAALIKSAQNSAGMRLRECHLRTAQTDAPTSLATVSSDGLGQSFSTELGVSMPGVMGPTVQNVKANVPYDISSDSEHSDGMDGRSETDERAGFIGRVKAAREARFRQKDICILLGIDPGTYKQYESRSMLPHRFLPKFCTACGVTVEWLLTGEGVGPKWTPIYPPDRRQAPKTEAKQPRRNTA
jgi:hypothetical protein